MRGYYITVNGQTYDVDVVDKEPSINDNESGGFRITRVQPLGQTIPTTVSAPAPTSAAAQVPQKETGSKIANQSGEGNQIVLAPMPGTIVMVNVKPGDVIKKGQLLMTLEAMKMENEIVANNEGIIKEVYVAKGDAVDSGAKLVSIG